MSIFCTFFVLFFTHLLHAKDVDPNKNYLVHEAFFYLSPTLLDDDHNRLLKEEINKTFTQESLERLIKLAPTCLKNITDFDSTVLYEKLFFLKRILNLTPEEIDDDLMLYLNKRSHSITQKEKEKDIRRFVEKYPISDGKEFSLSQKEGYKIVFHHRLNNELPDHFLNDITTYSKRFNHLSSILPLFLLIDPSGNIIGEYIINVDLSSKGISCVALILTKSEQGKGLGKAFFVETLKIIATNPVWGDWQTPFKMQAQTVESQKMIKTLSQEGLPMDIFLRKVATGNLKNMDNEDVINQSLGDMDVYIDMRNVRAFYALTP